MFKKICDVCTTILLLFIIVLALALFLPRVFGLQPLVVLSGSMEPTYHVGSLIYVQNSDSSEVNEGDSITFYLDNEKTTLVTHRVVRIDTQQQCFYTKGDANQSEDGAPVPFENVFGKPFFTIPYLGYIATFLQTTGGKMIAAAVVLFTLTLTFLPEFIMGKKIDSTKKTERDVVNID